jgi:hypothetical protein
MTTIHDMTDDMNDAEYSLSEPFDIDDGELEAFTFRDAFVLGVEWCRIQMLIDGRKAIKDQPIHIANRNRIENIMKRRNITYRIDESSDSKWLYLTVVGDLFPYPVVEGGVSNENPLRLR